jgi:alcohol dehydrogenase class IV
MVKPFQFSRLPRIFFKNGLLSELPDMISKFGNDIVLVCGKNSFVGSLPAGKLFERLKLRSVKCRIITVPGEPSPELIDNEVERFRNEHIDLIVAVGGGSVLDAGKALSAMMYRSESVVEFLEGVGHKDHPGTKLPFIAIPTTSGTGSEATKNAVLSRIGKNGFKRSLRHDNFVPDIALIDPELTYHCPKAITAASGMDCFTQLTESYLSDKSGLYTDALAVEGLRAIKSSLKRSVMNGNDSVARAGMSFAALTSGICLANAGLGAVHGFASSVGGMYDLPHGLICGSLMSKANQVNVRELRKAGNNPLALKKYANLGEIFLQETGRTDDFYIDGFIDYLYEITEELQLTGLKNLTLDENEIESVCLKTDVKSNPVSLTLENLKEILNSSIK